MQQERIEYLNNRFKYKLEKDLLKKRTLELNKKLFPSEKWFLTKLVNSRIHGYTRNMPLFGRFFGDFVWRRKKIVVEIDGSSHEGKQEYDRDRDDFLGMHGYKVIRVNFNDNDFASNVIHDLIKVYKVKQTKVERGVVKEKPGKPKLTRFSDKLNELKKKQDDFEKALRLRRKQSRLCLNK